MTDFTDLREVAENKWQAKYQGNYGAYTVKLTLDANGERTNFSCSCPSNYYPCKHIAMMENAVAGQKKRMQKVETTDALTVDDVLKHVSFEELRQFVMKQSKYNVELTNAFMREFTHKAIKGSVNPYSGILRRELKNVQFDLDDYYDYEDNFEIEPLNEWMEKAKTCLKQEKYEEALLICQACIEEFADWYQNEDDEVGDYIEDNGYDKEPFKVLEKIVEKTAEYDQKLYDYCKLEMQNSKYRRQSGILEGFNNLISTLVLKMNPTEFIALQDSLLEKISDKSSYEAKKVLERKIQFYRSAGQAAKADEIIENNLQIESFCRQTVEKRIANKQYEDAKRLIYSCLEKHPSRHNPYWNEYILDIAQKEKDVPTIRKTAFGFISSHFDEKYYAIYRATFSAEEWTNELENLIQHYAQDKKSNWSGFGSSVNFNTSVADLLVAEKATERLLTYLEKNLDIEMVEKYHLHISKQFPERILSLFRKTIDVFAQKNLGRDNYEYIKHLLEKMKKINGGEAVVNEMLVHYRTIYKTRRAMMEVLRSF